MTILITLVSILIACVGGVLATSAAAPVAAVIACGVIAAAGLAFAFSLHRDQPFLVSRPL